MGAVRGLNSYVYTHDSIVVQECLGTRRRGVDIFPTVIVPLRSLLKQWYCTAQGKGERDNYAPQEYQPEVHFPFPNLRFIIRNGISSFTTRLNPVSGFLINPREEPNTHPCKDKQKNNVQDGIVLANFPNGMFLSEVCRNRRSSGDYMEGNASSK